MPSAPQLRAEVIVFNEYGVQIMSPHYLGDPVQEKLVAKDGWHRAPAVAPR